MKVHRTIVQAGKRYDKLPAHKRTGKNVYLQAQCGHLVDSEGWEALLKRAKKCVDEAKQTTTKVNEAKSQRRVNNANKLKLALDEEEIPEDIEGWVVSVITWVHTLGRVLPHVQKLEVGMRGFESAKHILKDIGFGDTFVAQLVLRTLQEIGFACGSPILMMGTGAIHMSNRVCNATWTASNINVPQVYELFVALQPTFSWLVEGTACNQYATNRHSMRMPEDNPCNQKAINRQSMGNQ